MKEKKKELTAFALQLKENTQEFKEQGIDHTINQFESQQRPLVSKEDEVSLNMLVRT